MLLINVAFKCMTYAAESPVFFNDAKLLAMLVAESITEPPLCFQCYSAVGGVTRAIEGFPDSTDSGSE